MRDDDIANSKKKDSDYLTSLFMDYSPKTIDSLAKEIFETFPESDRLVLTGAAGAGKTSLSKRLSKLFDIPVIDLDDLVEGGFTKDRNEYERRLSDAWDKLISDLPDKYIVEHVEACNPGLVDRIKPNYAIYVDPGEDNLRQVAIVRSKVGKSSPEQRISRSVSSGKTARDQFDNLTGELVIDRPNLKVKKLK